MSFFLNTFSSSILIAGLKRFSVIFLGYINSTMSLSYLCILEALNMKKSPFLLYLRFLLDLKIEDTSNILILWWIINLKNKVFYQLSTYKFNWTHHKNKEAHGPHCSTEKHFLAINKIELIYDCTNILVKIH